MSEVELNSILVAAHELKAPLATLRQLAFALDPEDVKTLPRTRQQLISLSEAALRQVTDLSKIARLEDGLFTMEPLSIRSLCDEVEAELAKLFRDHSRHLCHVYTNKSRLVIANRELLKSIIYNFCTNALHYSSADTVSLLTIKDRQGKVRINIRDFGPALPMNIYQHLRSGTLHSPTPISMRPGSSGLGLYIATKFSAYMHAQVGATRHRDGTSFFIDLPVSHQLSFF